MNDISDNTKKRYRSMLLCSIFSTQTVIISILYSLSLVLKEYYMILTILFCIVTILSSTPHSKFSDEYGRRKHMIIASYMIILSTILIFTLLYTKDYLSQEILILLLAVSLLFLAVGSNIIPITRGFLVSLEVGCNLASLGYRAPMLGFGWIQLI